MKKVLLGSALSILAGACSEPPSADGPNVLLISVDTLRADHLGFHGYERPTSPRLDAFAESAVVFENAQASASWTLPGMATIFTSTYTSTHGCWDFGTYLDASFTTLTEKLLAAGYDTACIVSHVYCTDSYGMTQGFVHIDDVLTLPDEDPDIITTSHLISDRGLRFLRQKAAAPDGTPWFLWLHYFDPHGAYVPQEGFTEIFTEHGKAPTEIDLYDGEIAFTDHHIGRVLTGLEEAGLAGDTVVVLVADHGEEFWEHDGHDHGHALFAELIRVPFVIRAPGIAPRRVEDLVRTADLMPTVLELVGLPHAGPYAGQSLRAAMTNGAFEPRPALSEIQLNADALKECVLDGRYKLIHSWTSGEGAPRVETLQLFDLQEDPGELRDLASERPELVERMAATLDRLVRDAEAKANAYTPVERRGLNPVMRSVLSDLGYVEDGEDETQ